MNFEINSIGMIHSPFQEQEATPIQPRWAQEVTGVIEIYPEFVKGVTDLDGFERIWLVYWFHRVPRGKELSVIPYLDNEPRGVFATRVPSRPNPIGLSCVRLLAVEGARLHVAELDVLDATPLLDIKPYVPDFDVFSISRVGWYAAGRGSGVADGRFSEDSCHKVPPPQSRRPLE